MSSSTAIEIAISEKDMKLKKNTSWLSMLLKSPELIAGSIAIGVTALLYFNRDSERFKGSTSTFWVGIVGAGFSVPTSAFFSSILKRQAMNYNDAKIIAQEETLKRKNELESMVQRLNTNFERAVAELNGNHYVDAIRHFERTISILNDLSGIASKDSLEEQMTQSYYHLSFCLFKVGRLNDAMTYLNKAINEYGISTQDMHNLRGYISFKLYDYEAANKDFSLSLKSNLRQNSIYVLSRFISKDYSAVVRHISVQGVSSKEPFVLQKCPLYSEMMISILRAYGASCMLIEQPKLSKAIYFYELAISSLKPTMADLNERAELYYECAEAYKNLITNPKLLACSLRIFDAPDAQLVNEPFEIERVWKRTRQCYRLAKANMVEAAAVIDDLFINKSIMTATINDIDNKLSLMPPKPIPSCEPESAEKSNGLKSRSSK